MVDASCPHVAACLLQDELSDCCVRERCGTTSLLGVCAITIVTHHEPSRHQHLHNHCCHLRSKADSTSMRTAGLWTVCAQLRESCCSSAAASTMAASRNCMCTSMNGHARSPSTICHYTAYCRVMTHRSLHSGGQVSMCSSTCEACLWFF